MATIGNLGSLITFEVSSDKVQTFSNFRRSVSARWAQHDIIGRKSKSEYLGKNPQEITFEIKLFSSAYVKPWDVLKKIRKAIGNGTPYKFVMGGKKSEDING